MNDEGQAQGKRGSGKIPGERSSERLGERSDEQLLTAIAAHDEAAFVFFYERHAPLALAVCKRIVRNHSDAEQLLLDVFLEFWQRSAVYDPKRSSPRSYLMLIARSRALDFVRRRNARIQSDAPALDEGLVQSGQPGMPHAERDPLNRSIDVEQAAIVREVLDTLEPDQRRAIEYAFYEGMTYVEVATKLSLPLGTLKSRMRSALATLRKRLQKLYDEPSIYKSTTDPTVQPTTVNPRLSREVQEDASER